MDPLKIRETWLSNAVANLKADLFRSAGFEVPEVKVSVGFPSGRFARQTHFSISI